ncbi:MAG: hypothetical protein RM347_031780 [Nostoc sp. ChiQUE02]|uniref:hypothetical protein n=1 Tax=Nostoc sp. ChiQUE02 TaxID=3075377 RepID=UPI002AD49D6F|nr:hypothetical protein [Nostoc sp. ChiQUE02]MDZ8233782.1 hypothetical protein [Nostoc sp. ChiQUE02]
MEYREALQKQGTQLGEACLYFGCRNKSDFLYNEQLTIWQNQGVLTDLQVAFSRLTQKKVYVIESSNQLMNKQQLKKGNH